jgi:hypothetical protein
MSSKTWKWMWTLMAAGLIVAAAALANDIDDGISKSTDDAVSGYDELGSQAKNIKFIKMNAKSQAKVRSKGGKLESGASGGANMNSVVMGPGSNVKGDIIIIDESKGPKTIVTE